MNRSIGTRSRSLSGNPLVQFDVRFAWRDATLDPAATSSQLDECPLREWCLIDCRSLSSNPRQLSEPDSRDRSKGGHHQDVVSLQLWGNLTRSQLTLGIPP